MLKNPDHLSFVVRDLEAAKSFFALLGFEQNISTVISGKTFSDYMGVPDIEADHVTMVLNGCTPHFEVQLLHYRHPDPLPEPHIRDLNHVGFNHLCFAVDDIEAEVTRRSTLRERVCTTSLITTSARRLLRGFRDHLDAMRAQIAFL